MRINIYDKRVRTAFKTLKEYHKEYDDVKFAKLFEEYYHCKIISDDPFGINGEIELSEDKYQTWFVLNFGEGDE
jgi:hypothetical protein